MGGASVCEGGGASVFPVELQLQIKDSFPVWLFCCVCEGGGASVCVKGVGLGQKLLRKTEIRPPPHGGQKLHGHLGESPAFTNTLCRFHQQQKRSSEIITTTPSVTHNITTTPSVTQHQRVRNNDGAFILSSAGICVKQH